MRTMTLQPRYRQPGYAQQLISRLDISPNGATAYADFPPYDLEQVDQDHYTLSIAVPGFAQEDLDVSVEKNLLSIESRGREKHEGDLIHQGINRDSFVRRFRLGEHVNINEATLKNGLLTIHLAREIPEAEKPRIIPVSSANETLVENTAPEQEETLVENTAPEQEEAA